MIQHPESLFHDYQTGGNVKAFLLDLYRQNSGSLHIDEFPTEAMLPAIRDEHKTEPHILVEMSPVWAVSFNDDPLYMDEEGYICLKIIDVEAHTIDLIDQGITQFRHLADIEPDNFIPCPSRRIALDRMNCAQLSIPYSPEFVLPVDYDIIVRGKCHD